MENLSSSTVGTNLITAEGLANLILQQNDSEEAKFSVKDPFPENVRILDWTSLKDSKEKFKTGRIPGARFLDLNNKFIDPDGKYPTTFPPENIVRKRLGQLGVKRENEIILYSQTEAIRFATRAWYIFKSYGFTKVAVLNGGLLSWNSNNFPIESGEEPNEIETENDDLLEDCTSHLIDYLTVKEIEEKTDENTIIDARSQGQYEGREKPEMEGIPSGHIPNAVNIPSTTVIPFAILPFCHSLPRI